MAFPSYSIGTVSVNAGDTTIVGAGGSLWAQTANAQAGDDIVIAGHTVIVQDVTDDTHLVIDAWPYSSVAAGTAYKIVQRSPLRFAGGGAMAIVMQLLGSLNTAGLTIIVPATAAAPDPSLGEDGQFAVQPSTFKLWLKSAGSWVLQGVYKGFNITGAWNAATTYGLNDIVSSSGASYIAIAGNTNQAPPNATYWALLADQGPEGTPGTPGAPGAAGAGYKATSTTSLLIAAGAHTLTTQAGLAYTVGARARASSNANGANYMEGLVTAYADTSLTISVAKVGGAGTFADWNINIAGDPGSGDLLSTNNLSDLASKSAARANLGINSANLAAVRITLSQGVPVTVSDVAAATSIYLEPHRGNLLSLFDGVSNWVPRSVPAQSISIPATQMQTGTLNGTTAVSGLADTSQLVNGMQVSGTNIPAGTTITVAGPNSVTLSNAASNSGSSALTFKLPPNAIFDVFGFDNAGSVKLEWGPAWTNDTTRATAVVLQDGVEVKSGATTRRLLGSVRVSSVAGQLQDTHLFRHVSNRYNEEDRPMWAFDPANTWSNNLAGFRQANGNPANQLDYLVTVSRPITAAVASIGNNGSGASFITLAAGIGIDSTTIDSSIIHMAANVNNTPSTYAQAFYAGTPGIGRHVAAWLENPTNAAGATVTWYGVGSAYYTSGIMGSVKN